MRELGANLPVVNGRFRLVRLVGEGGMGVVWEAIEVASGRRCALKFLRDTTPDVQKRFLREAEAANAIHHPCILHIDELLQDDDGSFAFVMDLLEGESLAARLERMHCLSLGQTAAILVPVLDALRAAHAASVVHRDLKPDNIFITRERNGGAGVRVLDFGIARLVRPSEKLTVTGTLVGTPLYMSPEQAGGEAVDQRSDLWSIAALAFECFTGSTPVSGENYGQILARLIRRDVRTLRGTQTALPEDVVATVDSYFVDRNDRPADVSSLATVLQRYADPTIEVPPLVAVVTAQSSRRYAEDGATMLDASTAVRPPQTRAMSAIVAVLAVLALIGTAAGTAAFLLRRQHASTPATIMTSNPPLSATALPSAPAPSASVATTVETPAAPSAAPTAVGKKPGGIKGVPTPSASAPGKLPGGVARDVPF